MSTRKGISVTLMPTVPVCEDNTWALHVFCHHLEVVNQETDLIENPTKEE